MDMPPEGEMTVKAVRSMQVCCLCGNPGWDLITWDEAVGELDARVAHGHCIVKEFGLEALCQLRAEELDKICLSDVTPEQMRILMNLIKAARPGGRM